MFWGGESCRYDSIGNPVKYRGEVATWKGRQLLSYNGVAFKYDGRGRRIKKGTVSYYYDYEDKLVSGNGLDFFYDHIGVAGFRYGETYYTYKRDIQNNITAILDNNGNVVVKYTYDAWGNHTVSGSNTTLGNLNPFRYRGYFYDTETGLYYLKTRYYDPEVGRFLNMDSVDYADPEATDGLNLYAYCGNNPVMNVDPSGTSFILLAAVLIGAAFGALEGYVSAKTNNRDIGWGIALGALGGALMGLVTGGTSLLLKAEALAGQLMIVGMSGLVAGMSIEALNQVVNNEPINAESIIATGTSSMLAYSLSYGFSFGASKPLNPESPKAITLGTAILFEPIMILLGLPYEYFKKARRK